MARAEYGRYNPSHFLARRSRTTVRRAPGIFLQTADRRRAPPPTHYSIGKIRLTQRMYVSCASSPLDLRQLVRFDVAMKQLRQRRIERDALKHTVVDISGTRFVLLTASGGIRVAFAHSPMASLFDTPTK